MLSSHYEYDLPEELIADFPAEKREDSKLMTLDRKNKTIGHNKFFEIVDFLDENDVLVMNNTKVIPARLFGEKSTGASIEVFLLEKKQENIWEALIKPAKRVKEGTVIKFSEELSGEILEKLINDKWLIRFDFPKEQNFDEILLKVGNIPLPPYIEKKRQKRELPENIKQFDFERYQTVYAQNQGSVAAPTAGLHFTQEILEKLKQKGVQICYVTLNVGMGTFKPVKAENILEHKMEREFYQIPENTAEIINNAKQSGKNIVAVGTTTVRTLESAFTQCGKICPTSGWSELFIYPGYKFNVIDRLITNFHLPKSTLIMMISALAGKEFIFDAYKEAIEKHYRFYSYGDCMMIN